VSAATEEQLASMEEITAAATALSKMAEELQTATGRFEV
jgi:methyl-accepting chemotaxis protein